MNLRSFSRRFESYRAHKIPLRYDGVFVSLILEHPLLLWSGRPPANHCAFYSIFAHPKFIPHSNWFTRDELCLACPAVGWQPPNFRKEAIEMMSRAGKERGLVRVVEAGTGVGFAIPAGAVIDLPAGWASAMTGPSARTG